MAKQFSGGFEIPQPELINPSEIIPPSDPAYNPKNDLPTDPTKPGAIKMPLPGVGAPALTSDDDVLARLNNFIDTSAKEAYNPNTKTKGRAYGAGMDHHQFERYYNLPRVYNKLGFSPFRDNESAYNKESNFFDEIGRASTQWANLSGLGAKDALTFGDLTDTETARDFEKAMAIGSSSKGGAGGFITNLYLNSGYTMGILGEAALEEAGLALITGLSAGTAAEATIPAMIARGLSAGNKIMDGYNVGKNVIRTLDAIKDANKARQYFKQALGSAGKFINPLENTVDFIQGMDKLDNLTDMAKTTHAFANFYRDVRNVRLAWGEAGLEGGMVRNNVEQELLQEHLKKHNGRPPTEEEAAAIRETAIKAGTTTGWQNVGAIYFSNKIVFDNFFKSFKPIKNLTEDVIESGVHGMIRRNAKVDVNPFEHIERNWKNALKSLKDPKTYARTGLTYFKANLAEGLQESAQEIISGAASDYYKNEWRGTPLKGGYFAAITDNLQKQITPEGFEVFASGFLMGGMIQPVTKAPGYIKESYKKYANPEVYQAEKQRKEDYINKTVNQLNDLWNNTGAALAPDLENLAAQDQYSKGMAEATKQGDGKTYHDLKDASYYEHIYTALKMDRFDTFIERLEDQKNLTPEEVKEAFNMSQQEYFKGIDNAVTRARQIQQRYSTAQTKLKNPFNPHAFKIGTQEWISEMDNSLGWEHAQKKLVFMQHSFDRYLQRMTSIMEEAQKDSALAKVPQNEFTTLFQTDTMDSELALLKNEIDSLQGAKGESLKLLRNKQRKQKLLTDFNEKMKEVLDSDADSNKAVGKAKTAYKRYLKYLAEVNKDYAFDDALDGSFEKLLDYYKLNDDTTQLNKAINMILDPRSFTRQAARDAQVAKLRRENQQNEFRESLQEFLKAKEANDLIQLLYDEGIFFDPNDLEALITNGIMPDKFYYIPKTNTEDIVEITNSDEVEKAKNIIRDFVNGVMDVELEEDTDQSIISPVSDAEYQEFINSGDVSPERVKSIADKIKSGIALDDRETAIFTSKTNLVNEELVKIKEGELESSAEAKVKVTKKDKLTDYPELAADILKVYKETNQSRLDDGNDALDPDLENKSDEQIMNSIQFKNFYKVSNRVQSIIDDYNARTGRNEEPAAEPVSTKDVTIMSTAMRNRLIELGYKPGNYNVVQAQAIIDRGLTKDAAEQIDTVAKQLQTEILEQARGTIREEINNLINAANTLDELSLAEEEIGRMLDDTIEGTGRTGWDSSGYNASDLDALIQTRKDQLAFSFSFNDIYPGMTIILKNNEKIIIDEIKGDIIYGHKSNDITKLRKIKKSSVQDRIKYIFKTDMMDEDVVVPTETVTQVDTQVSNESQDLVSTSERDAVNKDWLSDEEEDLDPNC